MFAARFTNLKIRNRTICLCRLDFIRSVISEKEIYSQFFPEQLALVSGQQPATPPAAAAGQNGFGWGITPPLTSPSAG